MPEQILWAAAYADWYGATDSVSASAAHADRALEEAKKYSEKMKGTIATENLRCMVGPHS